MACITERLRAGKPSKWQAAIRLSGQPPIVKTFDTKELAQRFASSVEASIRKEADSSRAILEKLRRKKPDHARFYERRLRDVIEDFAFGPVDSDTGQRIVFIVPQKKAAVDSNLIRKRKKEIEGVPEIGALRHNLSTVLRHIGDITVGEAKGSWVARYVDKMRRTASLRGEPYSFPTIMKHLQLMNSACLRAAMLADVEEPKLYFSTKCFPDNWKSSRERRLELGEPAKIMARLWEDRSVKGRHWRCLYQLALETGARLQELVLAEWPEFVHSGAWVIPANHTKKKKQRIVSLSRRARRIVNLLRAAMDKDSGLVFHSFGTVASVSKGWAYRARKAGVMDFHFHDLRHEAISRMVAHPSNVKLERIQKMVGHVSQNMTDAYTHLRVDDYIGLFDGY